MPPALPPANQSAQWVRLAALDLDGATPLSFSKRLARDNGWPVAFAQRVVLEYKRFVFLAATCGHPVTPSDEVDVSAEEGPALPSSRLNPERR